MTEYREIYAYTYESKLTHQDIKYNSRIKIGETIQGVDVRVKQQQGASNDETPKILGQWKIPIKFHDHNVHRILKNKGAIHVKDGPGTEWFEIPGSDRNSRLAFINKCIEELTEDPILNRSDLELTPPQYEQSENSIIAFSQGKNTQLLEFCPRFGKTIWALCLLKYLDENVMVVCAYWLSALTSFDKDILKFNDFIDIVYVDSSKENYEKEIKDARNNNKKVVVGVSLCGEHEKIKEKYNFLRHLDNKIMFVDEADYGAWHVERKDIIDFISKRRSVKTILATGTNANRASTHYNDIDYYNRVTYFDLILAKARKSEYKSKLNLPFKTSNNMDNIPNVEFYQLNFPGIDTSEIIKKDNLPSWSKALENPNKAQGFIREVFGGLFNGAGNFEYMNMDHIFGEKPTGIMIWVPRSKRDNVKPFIKILQKIIPEWLVVELTGNETTNKEAEDYIRGAISRAEVANKNGVVVVSQQIGARSFSIPEIDTVVLAYDNGSIAETEQKMSRAFTRANNDKIAKVVSLSLDPTREDKLDGPILETAQKLAEDDEIDINEAIKTVCRTMNIFSIDHDSGERTGLDIDEYTQKILSVNSLSKIITSSSNINLVYDNPEIIKKLLELPNIDNLLGNPKKVLELGKKFIDNNGKIKGDPKTPEEKESKNIWEKIVKAINVIVSDSVDMAVFSSLEKPTIEATLEEVIEKYKHEFIQVFEVDPEFLLELIDFKIINTNLINLMISQNYIKNKYYLIK